MVFIGAHISREKTLLATLHKIKDSHGNALQIFASNPRSTKIANINPTFFENINEIKTFINKNNFSLIIHTPYTINLATNFIINKRQMDIKDCYWVQLLIHELKIAHTIGAYGCVVHCGKYTTNSVENGIANMKTALDFIIAEIEGQKLNSKIILETSSGQGTELLFNYDDFLKFYNSFTNIQKKYIKICIDTCHTWAANYEFDEIVRLTKKYNNMKEVAVIHINNSKNPKGSHLDRHETITNPKGFIPIEELNKFITTMRNNNPNITLIVETPSNDINKDFELIF
jgi:deoxyribonuclease-4